MKIISSESGTIFDSEERSEEAQMKLASRGGFFAKKKLSERPDKMSQQNLDQWIQTEGKRQCENAIEKLRDKIENKKYKIATKDIIDQHDDVIKRHIQNALYDPYSGSGFYIGLRNTVINPIVLDKFNTKVYFVYSKSNRADRKNKDFKARGIRVYLPLYYEEKDTIRMYRLMYRNF